MKELENILFIMPSFSFDGRKGYEKVVLQWCESISDNKNIHIINLGSSNFEQIYENKLNINLHNLKKNYFQIILNCILSLLRLLPIQTAYLRSKHNEQYVSNIIKDINPSKIIFVTIRTHFLHHLANKKQRVILAVDSMTLNFKGKYKNSDHVTKLIYFLEYLMLKFKENIILSQYNKIVFVSNRDALLYPNLDTCVIPLATKVSLSINPSYEQNGILLFSGNMDYEPNRSAVKWFYENVWLKYSLQDQHLTFVVCGRNAIHWKYLVNKKDIVIKSDVEDIYMEILESEIYVAPMQSGSGMQFKILEAMACGRPIVTSSLGMGSIIHDTLSDKLILADDSHATYEAIIKLHADKSLRKQMGTNALEFVSKHYCEEAIKQAVTNFLTSC